MDKSTARFLTTVLKQVKIVACPPPGHKALALNLFLIISSDDILN